MKWKRLGQIYQCQNFAQSPQALAFNDYVRVYFSTRTEDSKGKYLSNIYYVDFNKDFSNIINKSKKPVISLGALGSFDEHGIFPLNVLRDNNKIWGFISGISRRISVSVETSIGLSVSHDNGTTFERVGPGPILSSSLKEPFMIGDPFVKKYKDAYHMWYIYGIKWKQYSGQNYPDRIYKISHAISKDAVNWERNGKQIINDKIRDECQAIPTVLKYHDRYHMLFCYRYPYNFRKNKERSYRIGYAYSDDLEHWTRDDLKAGIDISNSGWDSDMLCYPHIFFCNEKVYLLYNGNEFGRYGFGLAVLESF